MRNLTRHFVPLTVALGIACGGFAALATRPLWAQDEIIIDDGGDGGGDFSGSARGHVHPEPDGSLFCHCSGTACRPCANA